jgi:hypothetical protein
MMGLKAVDSMGQAIGSFLGLLLGRPLVAFANLRTRALRAAEKVKILERIELGATKSMGRAQQNRRQQDRRQQKLK